MNENRIKFLSDRLKAIEAKCYKKMLPHDLTLQWALAEWQKLEGKCYYTKIPMRFGGRKGRHPFTLSFDRKDSKQGYVQCNVVLCCLSVNLFKSNMTQEQFAYILQRIALNAPKRQKILPNPF